MGFGLTDSILKDLKNKDSQQQNPVPQETTTVEIDETASHAEETPKEINPALKTLINQTSEQKEEKKEEQDVQQAEETVQEEKTIDVSSETEKKEEQVVKEPQFDGIYETEKVDVIRMENICKSFPLKDGGEFKLFDNLTFTISDFKGQGQFVSIIGASGCGKSQLIKMLAGISKPDSGRILLYGKEYDDKSTLPMVFQQPSVFCWRRVINNVALPLKLKGVKKEERQQKALEMLRIVGLEDQADKWARYPDLSGGQRQRVALARNLVANSQILLLDEATSALDVIAKREMQDALLNIYYSSEVDPTVINVTHDISEAVYLSNRIYILKPNPCQIYAKIDIDFGDIRRTQEIRNLDKFSDYVKQIENIMEEIYKS